MSPRSPTEGRRSVVSAYILIQAEVGKATQVTNELRSIKGIVAVDGVTGPYDVIARAEATDLDDLAKSVVMRLQSVEGVTRTLTCPVLQL
jgi:DNA-binding Lrp family transcriptional regulator